MTPTGASYTARGAGSMPSRTVYMGGEVGATQQRLGNHGEVSSWAFLLRFGSHKEMKLVWYTASTFWMIECLQHQQITFYGEDACWLSVKEIGTG